jgi:hypothetical protein
VAKVHAGDLPVSVLIAAIQPEEGTNDELTKEQLIDRACAFCRALPVSSTTVYTREHSRPRIRSIGEMCSTDSARRRRSHEPHNRPTTGAAHRGQIVFMDDSTGARSPSRSRPRPT